MNDMSVLVTGGSRGIGRAIATRFAREGASVALTYHSDSEAAEVTAQKARDAASDDTLRIETRQLDVRNSADVDDVVEDVVHSFDGLDVVINNAGIMDNQAAAMMSDEAWDSVIDTNLNGPFYVARAALTHFMLQRSGRIVNISSIAASGASGQANYAASKAGLVGLTKSLAKEYGPRGITANAVVPGLVDTDMVAGADERLVDHWEEFCPAGRLATVDDIADAVWYVSRPEASFVNGAVLRVSGGLDTAP